MSLPAAGAGAAARRRRRRGGGRGEAEAAPPGAPGPALCAVVGARARRRLRVRATCAAAPDFYWRGVCTGLYLLTQSRLVLNLRSRPAAQHGLHRQPRQRLALGRPAVGPCRLRSCFSYLRMDLTTRLAPLAEAGPAAPTPPRGTPGGAAVARCRSTGVRRSPSTAAAHAAQRPPAPALRDNAAPPPRPGRAGFSTVQ